jgi:hypothetical protein
MVGVARLCSPPCLPRLPLSSPSWLPPPLGCWLGLLLPLFSCCHSSLAATLLLLPLLLALLLALHLCFLLSLYASCASVWLRRQVQVCGVGGLGGLPL